MKQKGWVELLQQSQHLLCISHKDGKPPNFFFRPKTRYVPSIRYSYYIEMLSHLTRAKQESVSIHKLWHSYGIHTILEVRLCPPTKNVSLQGNLEHASAGKNKYFPKMSGVPRLSPLRFKFCTEVMKLWLVSNCALLFLLKTCPSHTAFQRQNNSDYFYRFLFSFAFWQSNQLFW